MPHYIANTVNYKLHFCKTHDDLNTCLCHLDAGVKCNKLLKYFSRMSTFYVCINGKYIREGWEVSDIECVIEPCNRWDSGSPTQTVLLAGRGSSMGQTGNVGWTNGFNSHTKWLMK